MTPLDTWGGTAPYRWTASELATLEKGIASGLSWDAIALALPGRQLSSIKTQAVKYGLARKMAGAYPQIPGGDEERIESKPDALLERLHAVYGEPVR